MPPVLMAENVPVWTLWQRVQTQWRVGMSLVGLDYPAVFAVAKLYDMDMTQELFAKIQALEFDTLITHRKKEQKA